MSNFQNDPFGMADFHAEQEAHYFGRGKQPLARKVERPTQPEMPPAPPPKDRKYRGEPAVNQSGPYPHIGPQIARKPVPASGPVHKPNASFVAKDSGPRPQGRPAGPPQPSKQPMKTIYTGSDGRFDTSTIRLDGPSIPTQPDTSTEPRPSHSRQNSSGSWKSFGSKNRADKRDSSTPQQTGPRPRGSSFSDKIKSIGRRVSDTVHIVTMKPAERNSYVVDKQTQADAEARNKRDSARAADHTGKQQPQSPAATGVQTHDFAEPSEPFRMSGLTKVVIAVSESLDAIKGRERANTNDSDMSFVDKAPVDAKEIMEKCNECNTQMRDYLVHDGKGGKHCKWCHDQQRWRNGQKAEAIMQLAGPSNTGICRKLSRLEDTDPDSPPYMSISGKHKLVKVRKTVYEDPGNPFSIQDSEPADHKPMSPMPFHPLPPAPPKWSFDGQTNGVRPRRHGSQAPVYHQLLSGSAFDGALETPASELAPRLSVAFMPDIVAPRPQRRGTPTLVKEHRRSMAVDIIPELESTVDTESEYVPPRTEWRKDSSRVHQYTEHPKPRDENLRDTRFYGFYDDLLRDLSKPG